MLRSLLWRLDNACHRTLPRMWSPALLCDAVERWITGPPKPRVDYVALARKINREDAAPLDLLAAYDRGEAQIVNGKLRRLRKNQ